MGSNTMRVSRRECVRGAVVAAGLGVMPGLIGRASAQEADLAGLKSYLVEHVGALATAAGVLAEAGQRYYDLAAAVDFDYQALWDAHASEVVTLLQDARATWTNDAHGNYEIAEGLVAGVPDLAYYDAWIDAGPSGEEDPAEAIDWTLELPNGDSLAKPGNIFHSLSEPALWGTDAAFVGLEVDLDDDGELGLGDALPEANILQAALAALDAAANELDTEANAWEPNLSDAFTALVVMIPTANEYFEQWKLSPFVLGEESTQTTFVANSRLLDVLGIYGGLDVTWNTLSVLLEADHAALGQQITTELGDLVGFVQDLYDQELAGTRFTPEQAEEFGAEVKTRADSLAGQITQAAALIDVAIQDG